ncbi:MAG: flavodoxin domain-containing protein [Halanaerobiaceae bacterium]
MKILIVYGTKHGSAEKCAKILSERINGDVDLVNLKKKQNINLDTYDNIIIGGSIYMGKIRKEVSKFCIDNKEDLLNKRIGLYISCMQEGEEAEKELKDNYPDELYDQALATDVFGGEFNFEKMNFLERMIIKKISGDSESTSNILKDNIEKFACMINNV